MRKVKYIEYLPIIIITLGLYFLVSNPNFVVKGLKVIRPILWGIAISYVMNPLAKLFQRKTKMNWKLCVLFAYLIVFILIVFIFIVMVPVIVSNITAFAERAPKIVKDLNDQLVALEHFIKERYGNVEVMNIEKFIARATQIAGGAFTYLSNGMIIFVKGLMQILLGAIISIYVLLSKARIKETTTRFIRVKMQRTSRLRLKEFIQKADRTFSGFLVGKLLDSLIIGIIAFIGFMFLRVPFAPLMALIIGITNIIPYFGPFIGGIPVVIISVIINPIMGLWTALFILLLQQLDGYIIGPKILGDSVGVSAFWVILGVVLGGGFFGFVGMILGVPTLAIIHSEFKEYISRKEGELNETSGGSSI